MGLFNNGLILQWGAVAVSGTNVRISVTLPYTFPCKMLPSPAPALEYSGALASQSFWYMGAIIPETTSSIQLAALGVRRYYIVLGF